MFQAGKTRKEHETRERSEGAQDGSGGRDEEELRGARAREPPAQVRGRIPKKTESLGGAGNRGKTEAVEELLQGERFENKIKLGEALGLAGLSKSTYEYDRRRLGKKEDPDEQRIMLEIKAVWLRSKKRYGYRKIAVALKNRYGETVNHKKVLRLRKERDVCAVLSGHGKYPDTAGRILHSDQGWQYQRPAYRSSLKKHGIVQSRSRKGNCLDNAKTKNLFSKLKKEMYYGHEKDFRSYAEVSKAINEYVQWYNEERIATRLRAAPVSHRSYAPIPLLCYTSH